MGDVLVSIGNLTNLETLAITTTDVFATIRLPDSIMKLLRLRNLYGNVSLPEHLVTAMWNLQVLSVRLWDSQIVRLMVEGKLPSIRKLGLIRVRPRDRWDLEGVLASVYHLSHLQTLKISYFSEHIITLPNSFPETITKISLIGVWLDDGGMEVLGKLAKLWVLKLAHCLSSRGLHIHAHSFPQLQVLKLIGVEVLEEWKVDEGGMPGLRHLVIDGCLKMTMLHLELRSLTALREMEVLRSNFYLADMFQRLQMELGFKLYTRLSSSTY
jgi:hypothetical protein